MAHPSSTIEFTSVSRAGWHVTVIPCGSEGIGKLVTDSNLLAKLKFNEDSHHLQVQPYKGRGNKYFVVFPLGSFSEDPALAITAITKAYGT